MPRITLTVSSSGGNIPVHVNTEQVIVFTESIAANRPGTKLYFRETDIFVEETYQEILEKEKAA